MKNILLFGKSKPRTRTFFYFQRAFRALGHRVFWVKYAKWRSYLTSAGAFFASKAAFHFFRPDFLFLHAADMPYELFAWASERIPTAMYYDDCIRGSGKALEKVVRFAKKADLFYLTGEGELPFYRQKGIQARFITGGVDPEYHRRVEEPEEFYQSEVAFIGRPNTPERVEFIRAIGERFQLKVYGSGWEKYGIQPTLRDVYAPEYQQICGGAKVVLGWNIDNTVELYFSNRTWYTLGCGGVLLTQYSPGLERIFQRGLHLDWFTTLEECIDRIEYYLQNPQACEVLREEGFRLAHEKYSFQELAKKILTDIQSLPSSRARGE